jgi:N-methylhydantoinase A
MDSTYRFGFDIGGTFTDFTLVNQRTGEIIVEKQLTTPHDPEKAVLAGVNKLAERAQNFLAQSGELIHATTLLTNVAIERNGAKTGLITTKGFRDILEIAREVRYDLYDLFIRYPLPLVPRRLRIGVTERVLADGSIKTPLDENELREALRFFRREGVEAIGVCFLHAYRNSAHERRVAEIAAEEIPSAMISLSHVVHPEPKEYERVSTTVLDAYVKPVAANYLDDLAGGLAELGAPQSPSEVSRDAQQPLYIMMSNGATATVETAKRFPVRMLESGPAAGVEAAAFYGRLLGISKVLSLDMGGTTAKLCFINEGKASRTRSFEVDRTNRFKSGSGIPIAIPVYDLLEIGAGGGSIARINDLGLLQIGPKSAGSDPGPACYGMGGTAPTVTDADLVLGFLSADYFLGGEMRLDLAKARNAVEDAVAKPASLPLMQAAWGIHDIVNETMASAARVYISDKAQVARNLTLICFGGAGPVHGVELARKLGCGRVVIPPYPGLASSFGLLTAPVAFEQSLAVGKLLNVVDLPQLERRFQDIENEAAGYLPAGAESLYERSLDLRHAGQDVPLEVSIERPFGADHPGEKWLADFFALYKELYGRIDEENPVEIANIRVRVSQSSNPTAIRPSQGKHAKELALRRSVFVARSGSLEDVPVYRRNQLGLGQRISGPAIIEERESTTVIGVGDVACLDEWGCLLIDIDLPRHAEARARDPAAHAEAR